MKNIETILKEAGVELTEEQTAAITKATNENYKPIADYNKQREKVGDLEAALKETKETLSKFDGVDLEGTKAQIDGLKKDIEARDAELKKKEEDYAAQLAERDFNDLIEKQITAKNGKNAKAIRALLDIDSLRTSKNQTADIEAALAELTDAEDSKMLFGEPNPDNIGSGNPIGTITKDGTQGLTGVEKAFFDRTGVRL